MDPLKFILFAEEARAAGHSDEDITKFLQSKSQPQSQTLPQSQIFQSSDNKISPNLNQALGLIKKHFPQDQWQNAYKVMMGESGGRVDAKGDDYPINGLHAPSYGLFQIRALPGRPSPEQLVDPEFNVAYAAKLFKQQGWNPWTVARNLGLAKG